MSEDRLMSASHTPIDAEAFGVSLIRGDLAYCLQRRCGLIPENGLGILRRALFWSLLAWLPIVVWAWLSDRALHSETGEPLLAHFGIHARFLLAVPLFIFAELPAHALGKRLLPYFVRTGIVPRAEWGRLRDLVAGMVKMRDASLPWIAIFAIALAVATVSGMSEHLHEVDWAQEAGVAANHPGFGGNWFLYVGRPIFLVLLLGWLWRAVLLLILFWRVAKLDLVIVPTHPDRCGGLGFLAPIPAMFAPVVFAIASVVAAGWGHDVIYHELAVETLRPQMIALLVVMLAIFLSPLLVFHGTLRRVKKQALLDYGVLVGRHGQLVHERWIEGRTVSDDAVLAAPELGPVADTATLYELVGKMRSFPVSSKSVMPIVIAAVIPMIVVLAVQVPLPGILKMLMKVLL